jgi:hypothetical protein
MWAIEQNMREVDKLEAWATSHQTPYEALHSSFEASTWLATGMADDLAVIIAGVVPAVDKDGAPFGVPWALASESFKEHSHQFLKTTRSMVQAMAQSFPLLINFVDIRNTASIRWLDWAGFTVDKEPQPFGVENRPFRRFYHMRSA